MESSKRNMSFDHIRIFACFSVVLLHVSAWFWYNRPLLSADWIIADAYNVLTRAGVPLFVMISGALFLNPDKETDIGRLWKKHILRLFVIYLLWMTIYAIRTFLQFPQEEQTIKAFVKLLLNGHYHLWFIPMLIGIYAMIPFLRAWTQNATISEFRYFFLLFFLFQIVRTSLRSFIENPEALTFIDNFRWEQICNYIGYFVLGYYLTYVGISEKANRILWFSLPICYLGNLLVSMLQNLHAVQAKSEFFDSFGIFTFFIVIAIFQFFTTRKAAATENRPSSKLVLEISKSTLGVYLMHLIIMESMLLRPLYSLPVILAIPLITICTFAISLIAATILRKLPMIGSFLC